MTTKRQKLQAMADQTVSPEEAKVAKAMLAKAPNRLGAIADDIRQQWGKGIEVEFSIGELLAEARTLHGGDDKAFGAWFAAQEFQFAASTAYNLRIGYERKPEVMAFLAARQSSARSMGVNTAVGLMTQKPKPKLSIPTEETTPADPAYAALREAHRRIVVEGGFGTMHVDDLAQSAVFIKELVAAYQSEKEARAV